MSIVGKRWEDEYSIECQEYGEKACASGRRMRKQGDESWESEEAGRRKIAKMTIEIDHGDGVSTRGGCRSSLVVSQMSCIGLKGKRAIRRLTKVEQF